MRIGLVTDALEERSRNGAIEIANGGVGVYVYHLVRELLEIAGDHELVLIHCGPARLDIYEHPRAETVTIPYARIHRYSRWVDIPYARLARSLRLDLVHYPNQFGGAGLPQSIRRVVTLHDLTPLTLPHQHPWRSVWGYRLLLRRSLGRADHVVVDSEATRREVIARRLAPAERITAIPLGVSEHFRAEAPDDAVLRGYDLPDRFVLSVGVLEPRKNHRLLYEALGLLHARGESVGLVIAGRDGWAWTDPLDDPALAALRPFVRVLRNVPDGDLAALYRRAAVFAYPSFHEGFGLPLVEAMACGVPVVTSRTSSLPEVGGDAALYGDPHDPSSFADAIFALLRDPPLRARLTQAGRRRAGELSWRRTAERTLTVYEAVCGAS